VVTKDNGGECMPRGERIVHEKIVARRLKQIT
jgi:hypothetical protein